MVTEIKSSIELCDQSKELQKGEEMRWSVTLATFFIRMTIPSLRVCFGVVYLELMQNEHMSNMDVSWIVAVFIACFNFSSPMSTTLSLYCSHRMLVFIGILLISLGLALCSLSLHLPYLVLSYGVLGGMGSSMASTNSFLATQKYFAKKKRSSFFASLGTSLSFLVMPMAIYGLVTFFTLRGSFLLWSSIILNGLVGAMFYGSDVYYFKDREHETIESHKSTLREPTDLEKEDQNNDSRHNGIEVNNDPRSSLMVKEQDKICLKDQNDNSNNIMKNTKYDDIAEKNIATTKPSFKVFQDANDSKHEIMKSLPELFEYEDCSSDDAFLDTKYHDMRPLSFLSTATSVESFKTMKSIYKSAENVFISVECMDMLGNNIVLEQDREFPPTDHEELQVIETQRMYHQNENSFPEISDTTNKSIQNLEANETVAINVSRPFDMLNLNPLRNGIFLAYLLSSVINKQIYLSYIIYLPLIAVRVGCQQQIPALFAIIATSEFVGKFSFSLCSKKKSMPVRCLYIVVSIMSALSFVALLFGNGFLTLVLASTGLGLGMGMCISLDPALLLQHFSAGFLSQSYGLILYATGAFSLIAYPLQGWALDKTESFKVLGIVMASLALIPAVSWLFTMICISSKKKNIQQKNYKI